MKRDRTVSATLFIVALVLAFVALVFFPFYGIRTNRTATGTGILMFLVTPEAFFLISGLFFTTFLCFLLRSSKLARVLGFAALSAVIPVLLIALSYGSRIILASELPQARVSFGLGFLLLIVALYVALASYAPVFALKSGRALRLAFFLAIACITVLLATGELDSLSLVKEYANRRTTFLSEAIRHGLYSGLTTMAALCIALPLGYLAAKSRLWEQPIFLLANAAQAVPTLSLLGLLIVPLSLLASSVPVLAAIGVRGVGWAPASIVLFLYALLPITANTQAGFRTIEKSSIDAAIGMGMTKTEAFFRLELPLALPEIIAGFRTALTQNLGNAVLAGLIGGGGLGSLIFLGLAQAAPDLILLGSLPVIIAVFAADKLLAALERSALRMTGSQGVST